MRMNAEQKRKHELIQMDFILYYVVREIYKSESNAHLANKVFFVQFETGNGFAFDFHDAVEICAPNHLSHIWFGNVPTCLLCALRIHIFSLATEHNNQIENHYQAVLFLLCCTSLSVQQQLIIIIIIVVHIFPFVPFDLVHQCDLYCTDRLLLLLWSCFGCVFFHSLLTNEQGKSIRCWWKCCIVQCTQLHMHSKKICERQNANNKCVRNSKWKWLMTYRCAVAL